ncbi:MAG: cation:dicarboxylate symporter family transporter [Lachnospirales bacterium]
MNELFLSAIGIAIFVAIVIGLKTLRGKYGKSFSFTVLTALVIGLLFGFALNFVFGTEHAVTSNVVVFTSLFSDTYVRALKMMVIPLVFVSMLTSIINTKSGTSITKIATKTIAVLVGTVAISAIIGIASIFIFNIDSNVIAESLQSTETVTSRADYIMEKQTTLDSKNYAEYITSFIPTNIFTMLTGAESTSTLSTVLFAMFTGFVVLGLKKKKPEEIKPFIDVVNSAKEVVVASIRYILMLTPYAVLGLITKFAATSSVASLAELSKFLVASYFAMIVMYIVHLGIVAIVGLNPKKFAKKTWSVLLFGFSSRSSMSAIPFNIEAQRDEMGVDEETASMSATFGTSIGQNGCAGIYPAMLAIMAAQIGGIQIDALFIIQLVIITAISSFGVAGVGGGATFAAITVLSIMGLDIRICALLISIEGLIDMGRTALNISDSMLAGVVTAKLNKTLDLEKYNS